MPPKGLIEPRRFCPYCSGEYAEGYLWLHKRDFCPMRPGRREQINAEIMGLETTGLQTVPQSDVLYGKSSTIVGAKGKGMAPIPPFNKFSNIIPINLEQEYANMVKVMKKKQEEEEEDNQYQCGKCKTIFEMDKQPANCPDCGVPFA